MLPEHLFITFIATIKLYSGEMVLRQIEEGGITSWGQLIEQDLEFARQHGGVSVRV
ncbi:MAG TPA: hypothetical protein VIS56_01180 [Candidatus Saccharimonadales bacterium]